MGLLPRADTGAGESDCIGHAGFVGQGWCPPGFSAGWVRPCALVRTGVCPRPVGERSRRLVWPVAYGLRWLRLSLWCFYRNVAQIFHPHDPVLYENDKAFKGNRGSRMMTWGYNNRWAVATALAEPGWYFDLAASVRIPVLPVLICQSERIYCARFSMPCLPVAWWRR